MRRGQEDGVRSVAFSPDGKRLAIGSNGNEAIKLWDVEPANELLSDRAENEAYLAAKPGVAYALHLTNGGAVGLDLTRIHGPFDVRWIDIRTGEWGKHEPIQGGSVVTLRAPADGHWAAAVVRPKSARD